MASVSDKGKLEEFGLFGLTKEDNNEVLIHKCLLSGS